MGIFTGFSGNRLVILVKRSTAQINTIDIKRHSQAVTRTSCLQIRSFPLTYFLITSHTGRIVIDTVPNLFSLEIEATQCTVQIKITFLNRRYSLTSQTILQVSSFDCYRANFRVNYNFFIFSNSSTSFCLYLLDSKIQTVRQYSQAILTFQHNFQFFDSFALGNLLLVSQHIHISPSYNIQFSVSRIIIQHDLIM